MLAWSAGLVARGAIKSLDDLLPNSLRPLANAELAAAEQEHAFMMWWTIAGGAAGENDQDKKG